MKASGKREKGKRLELKVASLIRQSGLDPKAGRELYSGGSWAAKGDIHTTLPYTFECKSQEKVKLWEFWQQARNQKQGNRPPVLCVSGNFRPILAIMEIGDWLNLVKEAREK